MRRPIVWPMQRFANSSSEGFCRPFGAYSLSHRYPRLAPWAAFFRRFAASRFRFVGDINGGITRDSTYQRGGDRTRLEISAAGIEHDSRYQRWGSKATFTRTLVSVSAGVYFHFLTALTAHSARMGLPPTTEIVSTEPPGETTTSRRTMPPM